MNEIEEAFEEEAELDFTNKDGAEMYKEMYKRLMENMVRKVAEQMKGKMEEEIDRKKYRQLISEYIKFKRNHVRHFKFNSALNSTMFGEFLHNCMLLYHLSGEMLPHSTLQLVQIYFDTATFDNIEKEKKVKFDAQLSLIGGTMGLLSGFSIISGIEIVFFLFRLGRPSKEIILSLTVRLNSV